MRGRYGVAAVAVAAALIGGAQAQADSGSISDPSGDLPDIIKLAYNNADNKVVMTMTYSEFRAQNESFYMRWGDDKYYQVFRSFGQEQLRLNDSSNVKNCDGLKAREPSDVSTKVIVPRSCLKKAPDKLKFQGIATEGLANSDETKITKAIARG
jgi:hypothetical protein